MNKLKKILKDKKGASLMMVLACMVFLVTLAASTLISALGAASVTGTQKDKARIDLLAESLQISLQGMLNEDTVGADNLQTAIVRSVYNYSQDPTVLENGLFDTMTVSIDEEVIDPLTSASTTETHSFECKLDQTQMLVTGTDVSGVIWIEVKIDLDPLDTSVTGEAVYKIGYRLNSAAVYDPTADAITTYGKWALVAYEKVES